MTSDKNSDVGAMIFHHPGEIFEEARSGSQVRPIAMMEAFKALGYEVIPVIGYGSERKKAIRQIMADLRLGKKIDFVYSEARSIPTLLSEKNRLPRYPLLDFNFLRAMRRAGVPVGLFYRDVFWRFKEMYRTKLPWYGRAVTLPLYWYDWWQYQSCVDHLFLPSQQMADFLPTPAFSDRCSALPPGAVIPSSSEENSKRTAVSALKLLYVGGVSPPFYNLMPLLETVKQVENAQLTLCCRQEEWATQQGYYADVLCDRVKIVHLFGSEVESLYQDTHLFGMLWKPNDGYLKIAVPIKLFESLGQGVPVITLRGNESARIVESENMGWAVDDSDQAIALLNDLIQHPERIAACRQHLLELRHRHTWQERAKEAARVLNECKKNKKAKQTLKKKKEL